MAINLFFRNMPRLSADIDLTYLPIEPREEFLKNISIALNTLAQNIKGIGNNKYQVEQAFTKEPRQLSKLIVSNNTTKIIIEPHFVLRGAVSDCETRELFQLAQNEFLSYFTIQTLS